MSTQTEYRIEWTGNIQVHYPIKPKPRDAHALLAETAVSCA